MVGGEGLAGVLIAAWVAFVTGEKIKGFGLGLPLFGKYICAALALGVLMWIVARFAKGRD